MPGVTYVTENFFVIEYGNLQLKDLKIIINLFTAVVSRIEKRQTTSTPFLNVNVTIDPAQNHFRVPRENLMDGEMYTVRVSSNNHYNVVRVSKNYSNTCRLV